MFGTGRLFLPTSTLRSGGRNGIEIRRLIAGFAFICMLAVSAQAEAGILDWAKTVYRGVTKAEDAAPGTILRTLTKEQALTLSAGSIAGAIYIESNGARLTVDALATGVRQLDGALDDLPSLARQARKLAGQVSDCKYVMTRQSALELGAARLGELEKIGSIYVVEPLFGPMRVVAARTPSGVSYLREMRPGVLVPLESEVTKELHSTLMASAKHENLAVVSMYASSDIDSLSDIMSAAGDRLIHSNELLEAVKSASLRKYQGKTLIVVGHIENNSFVLRSADGQISSALPLEMLEQMALKHDVTIISAGCASFCSGGKIGYIAPITDQYVANVVDEAFKSETLGDMLAAFGRGNPLVVSEESIASFVEKYRLDLIAANRHSAVVDGSALTVRLFNPIRRPWLSEETLGGIVGTYILGTILTMIMFRSVRDAYIRVFTRLPSPALPSQRGAYVASAILRSIGFVLISPIIMVCMLSFILAFGGWRYRMGIIEYSWRLFRNPLYVMPLLMYAIASLVYSFIVICFRVFVAVPVYLVTIGLLLVPFAGMLIIISEFNHSLVALSLSILLALFYCVVTLWIFRRLNLPFSRWLNSDVFGANGDKD